MAGISFILLSTEASINIGSHTYGNLQSESGDGFNCYLTDQPLPQTPPADGGAEGLPDFGAFAAYVTCVELHRA